MRAGPITGRATHAAAERDRIVPVGSMGYPLAHVDSAATPSKVVQTERALSFLNDPATVSLPAPGRTADRSEGAQRRSRPRCSASSTPDRPAHHLRCDSASAALLMALPGCLIFASRSQQQTPRCPAVKPCRRPRVAFVLAEAGRSGGRYIELKTQPNESPRCSSPQI